MFMFVLTIPTTPLNDVYHGGTSFLYRFMKSYTDSLKDYGYVKAA